MHVPSENIPHAFFIIFPLHILTVLIGLGVNGLFIYDLFTNDRIKGDKKALWGVVLLLGGILALPAYWYLYIRKTPSPRRKKST